jgi:hypothetical protein
MAEAPRLFISYSHDSYSHDSAEHINRILALSNRLRMEGIDCSIGQYEESPPEGWPQWCDNETEIGARTFTRRETGRVWEDL